MLSIKSKEIIERKFLEILPLFHEKKKGIVDGLNNCSEEEELFMKFLYISMPLSDIGNYAFDTFLDYAKHGVYLWKNGPYKDIIPEEIFLQYVLHHRINEEEITKCRSYFYEKVKDRTKGLTMKEAALAVNYWCAEEVTYEAADERTASPMAIYNSAYGRCGEESAFTVSVLRSAGIPARQVYAPRWSHCDDNHAWVEVWCEGKWHFLGACEPEEILDKGWFVNASSRAMLVHSRWFMNELPEGEEIISTEGKTTYLNQLSRYAKTKTISIKVVNRYIQPEPYVNVDIEVLNYSELFPVASMVTDINGEIKVSVGLGTLHLHFNRGPYQIDKIIDTREKDLFEFKLFNNTPYDKWISYDVISPVDHPVNTNEPTPEQKKVGEKKTKEATDIRLSKVKSFYSDSLLDPVTIDGKAREEIKEILQLSRGNTKEIIEFLKKPGEKEDLKIKLLKSLKKKDYMDIKEEILTEHFNYSLPFEKEYKEDIFVSYVLNPRVHIEPLTKYRQFIEESYPESVKDEFRKNPELIWQDIKERIVERLELENHNLITTPKGCLEIGTANLLSKKILFVSICRTLGIPARLNEIDLSMEYYKEDKFHSICKKDSPKASLILGSKEPQKKWSYFTDWTLAVLLDGKYKTLNLKDEMWNNGKLKLRLETGSYRIITSNRLPNGNIFSYKYYFTLDEFELKKVLLILKGAKLSDMLESIEIPDFDLLEEDGSKVKVSKLAQNQNNIFLWLEESKEPTEHILNELYEQKHDFHLIKGQIIFILKDKKALENPTIARTLKELPNIKVYYDGSENNINFLSRRMYVDPDKLPLIISTKAGLTGVYATSGYNVGIADMLYRINKELD